MPWFPDAVGVSDLDERYQRLSENGDPLLKLAALIDFEAFRPKLATAMKRYDSGLASEKWRALSVKEEISNGRTQEAVHP